MSVSDVNLVKNARFDQGKAAPRHWSCDVLGETADWRFSPGRIGNGDRAILLRSQGAEGGVRLLQRIRVDGEQFYRIEAVVRCDIAADRNGDAPSAGSGRHDDCGLRLLYRALERDSVVDEPAGREAWHKVGTWAVLRDYYQTPEDASHLEIELRLENAPGQVWVDEVRVIPVEEPEATSHPLAFPLPPQAYPAPRRARSVAILMPTEPPAGVTDILTGRFGKRAVRIGTLRDYGNSSECDAAILQGAKWTGSRPRLKQLLDRGEEQLLILSTSLFAEIVNERSPKLAEVRVNSQEDDPIHALVAYANFLTRGFALCDVFPLRWEVQRTGTFVQRYIRMSKSFKAFCKKHGFEMILQSEGDKDANSGHGVCLYRPAENGTGGIVVLDLDALGFVGGDEDAANATAFLLFNALGVEQAGPGQFTLPQRCPAELTNLWRDFHTRATEIDVETLQPAPPAGPHWKVSLGTGHHAGRVSGERGPAILLRSGFAAEDWSGVYGVLYWLKGLVRPEPFACAYQSELTARHPIIWFPIVRPDRWLNTAPAGESAQQDVRDPQMEGRFGKGAVGLAIDVTCSCDQTLRAVFPSERQARSPVAARLKALYQALGRKRFYCYGPATGTTGRDRTRYAWRWDDPDLTLDVDPKAFASQYLRACLESGATTLRLELPGGIDVTGGHSIWRTDRAASLVEWAIGAYLGVIAVNRSERERKADLGLWQDEDRKSLVFEANGQPITETALRTGRPARVTLGPGHTWLSVG